MDHFVVSDHRQKVDLDKVCELLADTYWAAGRPRHVIEEVSVKLGVEVMHDDCHDTSMNPNRHSFTLVFLKNFGHRTNST